MSFKSLQALSSLSRSLRLPASAARVCRQCLSQSRTPPSSSSRTLSLLSKTLNRQGQARAFSFTPRAPAVAPPAPRTGSPLGKLADSMGETKAGAAKRKAGWFPETSDKVVGYWLLGSAGLVFSIVVLGGLTRLTESGLSITEWKPVTGTLPPMSLADWEDNFAKYRDSPEYRLLNPNMTLSEYKFIYYMEWSHRLLGRVIGLSFVIPAVYFTLRRRVSARTARRIAGISGLIGFQGFLGWWMVKSGLRDDLFAEPGAHPRVSQYRLTAHLGAAFAVYAAMLWSGLDILRTRRLLQAGTALAEVQRLAHPRLRVFRGVVGALAAATFVTAMSGGLVAGLDAGLVYNEFPYMGQRIHPPAKELMDPLYSRAEDRSDLVWRNMLENPVAVQFNHRVLATTTFSAIVAAFVYSRRGQVAKLLPTAGKKGMMGVLHLALMQVTLGICTLIYMVPTPLAAAHQAGSLALLTGTIILGSRVWLPKYAARIATKRMQMAAAAKVGKKA